ncbi:5'-nucleotidase C-terminal domain-containing protein [Fluviicola taffensis]|uniref:5'-Nucleotidase domain-containing protein n=1 Tax=Fluviicola taffensis (strain DSM 16823 / NCIMB 13979 / RW262) TaxID=755732 RepID=F2IGU3_FLUTR|nr:5'-nucleotidase [Fluviicola taffensis]AEA44724.1 5'-Nucleotidase domain-containing protein [Fluviicola taffensis DSM 16823]
MEKFHVRLSLNNMKKIVFLFFLIGAGLTACSYHLQINGSQQNIDGTANTSVEMDSMVAPYRREMLKEFGVVIGSTTTNLVTGRPNSSLGFWICDKLIQQAKDSSIFKNEPVVAFINIGGLRADLPAGNITVGDIYKVMPFDNRVVYLKLSLDRLPEMETYLKEKGGEPIGGFKLLNGKLIFPDNHAKEANYFWVVTSDFLANGGDNMFFFNNPLERIETTILFRDLIIEAVKKEQKITFSGEERINW